MESIVIAIVAVLVPAAATYLAVQFGKLIPIVDGLNGIIKQLLAVIVAFVFAKLASIFGVPFPADLAGFADPTIVTGVLAGIASWILHKVFKPVV